MAFRGKSIENKITGQAILFLQTSKDTNGRFVEMNSVFHPGSMEPPLHYHPRQEEFFYVLEGELTMRLGGKKIILYKGQKLHIGKNEVHSMWNASNNPVIVNWKVIPALDTEYLLENLTGMFNDGKISAEKKTSIFQAAVLGKRFSDTFRLARPVFALQILLFYLVTPFARVLGYKAIYEKYTD